MIQTFLRPILQAELAERRRLTPPSIAVQVSSIQEANANGLSFLLRGLVAPHTCLRVPLRSVDVCASVLPAPVRPVERWPSCVPGGLRRRLGTACV